MSNVFEIISKMTEDDQKKAWYDFSVFGNMFSEQNADGTYRYIDIRSVNIESLEKVSSDR